MNLEHSVKKPQNEYRGVPYTEAMPSVFEAMSGYPLVKTLPALFFKVPGGEALRVDYRLCATRMFVDNFTKQIGQWCADHHCDMTGHFMAEDDFSSQIYAIGAAMPHYEYMQSPGIDLICRRQSDPLLPRQTSSAAWQFGRRRILAESFGGSGWNHSFKEQKWIADWLFVHGVTYMNQHLAYYSAWGGRKRDWPPSIHYQQPWWPHYPTMADYMARVNLIARSGEVMNDILVIHTISSGWATWTPDDQMACAGYSQSMVNVSQWLGQMQRDHDYGDETLLARYGEVKDGCLHVNKAAYKLVVLPPSLTLAHTTVALLKSWLDSGGKLLSVGEQPTMADGRPAKLSELWQHANCILVECSQAAVQDAIKMPIDEPVSVTQDGHYCDTIHVRQTTLDDGRIATYLINRSLDKELGMTDIRLAGSGELTKWNLDTGAVESVNYDYHDGAFHLTLPFGIVQSHMLVMDGTKQPKPTAAQCVSKRIVELSADPQVKITQPNALPLDYAKLTIPGVLTPPVKPVIFCTEDVTAHLGISADLNNGGFSLWKINKERKTPAKELDITKHIKPGVNTIGIELFSSPRNLLGPLHNRAGEVFAASPQYFSSHHDWVDRYMLVPYALHTPPRLVISQ